MTQRVARVMIADWLNKVVGTGFVLNQLIAEPECQLKL